MSKKILRVRSRWATIRDYKHRLKHWGTEYLRTGCPYREVSRRLLWWGHVRGGFLNDALSLLGMLALFFGPIWCLLNPSYPGPWWFWLGLHPLIVLLGYGPLGGVGEALHGDPLAEVVDDD